MADMKRFLLVSIAAAAVLSAPALAADMPARAPVYKAAPAALFDWTGFYVGATAGWAWGNSEQTQGAAHVDYNVDGFVGGGTIGYNWQFSPNWVVGIEADFSGSDIYGSGPSSATFGCGASNKCETRVTSFGTVRGRLGYAVDRTLYYATGGWAYARQHADIFNTALGFDGRVSSNGYAVGGGIEQAFAGNWTAKIEYLYIGLGRDTYAPALVPPARVETNFSVVRVGLNYKFGH